MVREGTSWNKLVIYELHLGTFNDNGITARRLDGARIITGVSIDDLKYDKCGKIMLMDFVFDSTITTK
jgi:1,4-alpha-glucan branching enzyme